MKELIKIITSPNEPRMDVHRSQLIIEMDVTVKPSDFVPNCSRPVPIERLRATAGANGESVLWGVLLERRCAHYNIGLMLSSKISSGPSKRV